MEGRNLIENSDKIVYIQSEKDIVPFTTLALPVELHDELEKLKIHPREPYYDVVKRLVIQFKLNSKMKNKK